MLDVVGLSGRPGLTIYASVRIYIYIIWLVLSDEQMSKRLQFSLLNDQQTDNWVGGTHLPVLYVYIYI